MTAFLAYRVLWAAVSVLAALAVAKRERFVRVEWRDDVISFRYGLFLLPILLVLAGLGFFYYLLRTLPWSDILILIQVVSSLAVALAVSLRLAFGPEEVGGYRFFLFTVFHLFIGSQILFIAHLVVVFSLNV